VADEVARLERLGAAVVERHDGHTVIRDPEEGNEFCVEPGPAGR
jgi:Glyoxalase-like domain